jgi:hypothetical protein
MKSLNLEKFLFVPLALFAALLFVMPGVGRAQLPGGDKSAAGMNSAMVKLFGNNTNFVSKAEAHVLDKKGQELTMMPMSFAMLGARIRVGLNLTDVKSREVSPDFIASMKQMGMDQMITILLPDKKLIRSIYPGLKAYAETPMDKAEAESATKNYRIEKTRLGKETIDGHACEKDTVTVTDEKGVKQSATVWYATDMHDVAVQIQINENESILILKFKDVKLGRPELSLFEAPAGYAKYDSINALMSEAITKKMGSNIAK